MRRDLVENMARAMFMACPGERVSWEVSRSVWLKLARAALDSHEVWHLEKRTMKDWPSVHGQEKLVEGG